MPGKAWEACAGRSAILPNKTTAFFVSVILFPCVVALIITLARTKQRGEKKGRIERRNEENA